MRSFVRVSAAAVIISVGLAGCNTVDKPVANPYLPDAITTSLGSTVEYNKLCQSDGVKAPANCRRAQHPTTDAERAALAVTKLKKSTEQTSSGTAAE